MDEANKRAVDEVIENLKRIPKEITSIIDVKAIIREIEERLKIELRRRVSYTGGK